MTETNALGTVLRPGRLPALRRASALGIPGSWQGCSAFGGAGETLRACVLALAFPRLRLRTPTGGSPFAPNQRQSIVLGRLLSIDQSAGDTENGHLQITTRERPRGRASSSPCGVAREGSRCDWTAPDFRPDRLGGKPMKPRRRRDFPGDWRLRSYHLLLGRPGRAGYSSYQIGFYFKVVGRAK